MLNYLFLALWVGATGAAYWYGGRKMALIAATGGLLAFIYKKGAQDNQERVVMDLQAELDRIIQERQRGYDQVDNRGTTSDDVIERLRKHQY